MPNAVDSSSWNDRAHHAAFEENLSAIFLLRAIEGSPPQFEFTDVNTRGCEMLGISAESARGQRLQQLMPGVAEGSIYHRCVTTYQSGDAVNEVLPIEVADVTVGWVEHHILPVPGGLVITSRDVTSRERSDRALGREIEVTTVMGVLAQELIGTRAPMEGIAHRVLVCALALTGASHGFVAEITEGDGRHEVLAGSGGPAFDQDADGQYSGLFGMALQWPEPSGFFSNQPEFLEVEQPLQQVGNICAVPAVLDGELVGQIAVMDRPEGFLPDELDILRRLATVFAFTVKRRRTEQALVTALRAAKAATQAKSDFLATMSHEIRTPLNGVIGMTALLLEGTMTDEQRSFAETISSSGESLLTIINDILDFSKIEAGRLELESQPFSPRHAVEEALALVAPAAQRKGLELVSDLSETLPLVRGDAGRLRQVLLNLLSNALKFTAHGEVVVSVQVKPVVSESMVTLHFSVRDTGVGIDPKVLPRLFQPFTQADASTTRRFGGTGLGLSICRRLVGLMGGEVQVLSEIGVGSEFSFELTLPHVLGAPERAELSFVGREVLLVEPCLTLRRVLSARLEHWGMQVEAVAKICDYSGFSAYRVSSPGLALLDAGSVSTEAASGLGDVPIVWLSTVGAHLAASQRSVMKPVSRGALREVMARVWGLSPKPQSSQDRTTPRLEREGDVWSVLVVEDNLVNQRLATLMLERLGCEVTVAEDGVQALAVLGAARFDLVFMDCQMPKLDGYETTRELRHQERLMGKTRTPVVAMTANAMQGDRGLCLEAGMDDYLAKPIRPARVKAVLNQWLPS